MKIGILGAGQLGKMLAIAGYPLGHQFGFMGNSTDEPACALGQISIQYNQNNAVKTFGDFADVISYESENIDSNLLGEFDKNVPIYPSEKSLFISQHRGREKALFNQLNIPCAPYKIVNSLTELKNAANFIGLPAILKTSTGGYDGRGQFVIHKPSQIQKAWQSIDSKQAILEKFIHFKRELSLIAVRGVDNDHKYYPLIENTHQHGILLLSKVPAQNADAAQKTAQIYMQALLDHMNHIGVLTIELFETEQGLIVNEMAPRVHNSGHWSIEGAQISQFENHIRAISGMPLGATTLTQPFSAMINIIGKVNKLDTVLKMPNAHLHLYAKTPRKNRKLGHITITASSPQELDDSLKKLAIFLKN